MSLHKTVLRSLHHFCKEGNYEKVKEILEGEGEGALERKKYHHADPPLLVAADAGRSDIVELLLLYGADVNSCDNRGEAALHLVAAKNHADCAKLLLSSPTINIGLKSRVRHLTPYEIAKQYKSNSVKKLLKSAEIRNLAKEAQGKEQVNKLLQELESLTADEITQECYSEVLLATIGVRHDGAAIDILHFIAKKGSNRFLDLQACFTAALEQRLIKLAAILFVCILVKLELFHELLYILNDRETLDQPSEVFEMFLEKVDLSRRNDVIAEIRDMVQTIKCSDLATPILFAISNPKQAETVKQLLWHKCVTGSSDIVAWKSLSLPLIEPSWLHDLHLLPVEKPFLKRICKLDLRKNRLRNVPAELFQLPQVNVIYLDSNKLEVLPDHTSWSRSLLHLYLSKNQLTDLPETMAEAYLKTLKVNHNKLARVPKCICELVWLDTLDLAGNPAITNLPVGMGRLTNLSHFMFDSDKIRSPVGWQSHYQTQNPQSLVHWLQALLRSSKKFVQVKLMVTGWQAKGKTTLIHRLNDDFNYDENIATPGIQISSLKESRSWWSFSSSDDDLLSFQVWDFAGQEDFYVTHMCFLSAFALYLLVWNLAEGEDGIKGLSSWLNNISARTAQASHKSTVIIVGTHLDLITADRESYVKRMRSCIWDLIEERKDEHVNVVDVVEVSCSKGHPKGIDNLKTRIYSAVKEMKLPGELPGDSENGIRLVDELVPHGFTALAKRILEMRSERQENKLPPILTRQQLRTEVSQVIRSDPSDKGRPNDPNDFQRATQFLKERGFILYFNDSSGLLRDLYFIDPCWLCDLMSHIITVPFTSLRKRAILNKSDLQKLMQRDDFPSSHNQQYIQLLNRFQVAYSLTDEEMLVPSQLPEEKPDKVVNEENNFGFTPIQRIYSIAQMPHGLFSRLIVILLCNMRAILKASSSLVDVQSQSVVELLDKNLFCWRSGIYFRDASLLFMVTSLLGPDSRSANLEIKVSPDESGRKALSSIVEHVEALITEWFSGMKKHGIVRKVSCHACDESGHDAHAFDLEDFEHDKEHGEHFKCAQQNVALPLHHVAPDMAFHDVEDEYLLQEEHLNLDQNELNELGKGDFGTVYRGECRGKPAAIKVFKGENPYREVRKEVSVLRRVISHSNLVSMLGVSRRPLCIAMELADRGSLNCVLFAEPLVSIPRIVCVAVAREIADALCFLHHSLGIVHRDLKPANILLYSLRETDPVHVKLTDFGTTGFVSPGGLKSLVGPTAICAPEMLEFTSMREYGSEVDVYSFAMFLYNLVTRRKAFHMLQDSGKIRENVLNKGRPPWKDVRAAMHHFANLTQLMCRCWSHAPIDRPSAAQVHNQLSQPLFQLLMSKVCFKEQRALRHATFVASTREVWFVYCTSAGCIASILATDELKFKRHVPVLNDSSARVLFTVSTEDIVVIFLQNSSGDIVVKMCPITSDDVIDENSRVLPLKSLNDVAVSGSDLYLASEEGCYVMSVDKSRIAREHDVKKCCSEESLSVAVVSKEVWLATRDSIHVFLTCSSSTSSTEVLAAVKVHEVQQRDLQENTSSNAQETLDGISVGSIKLDSSQGGQYVWVLQQSVLTKFTAVNKTELFALDCVDLLRSTHDSLDPSLDRVTCFSLAHDTVWLGTGSGFILIANADTGKLLAWGRPYETQVTNLVFCASAQPSRMISIGSKLHREGLTTTGDQITCPLALEKTEVIESDKQMKVSDGRGSQKRKLRGCLSDSTWTETSGSFTDVALVWETLSAARIVQLILTRFV